MTPSLAVFRARLAGALLIVGSVCFWVTWALMPMPGTRDAAFIMDAVSAARSAVWLSCVVQLLSAAVWAAALVSLPEPTNQRGQLMWWAGLALLAVGMTGNSADAIFHLVAFELTHPDVAPAVGLQVMTRFQGPDLVLLLPTIAAFFAGLMLLAVAAVRAGFVARASLVGLALVPFFGLGRALLPGTGAPRVAALMALASLVSPMVWLGWSLLFRRDY